MSSSEMAGIGFLLGFVIILSLIILACAIIIIVAKWKILVKAGEDGWKAIIPIYSDMMLCKISGVWFWYPLVVFGVSAVTGGFSGSSSDELSIVVSLTSLIGTVVSIYYSVMLSFSLAKSFGKDTGFGVGLMLLRIVFYPILGFGKSEYVGAMPINDPIMGSITKNQNQPSVPQQGNKICPNCGNNNTTDSSFCEKCGNKL